MLKAWNISFCLSSMVDSENEFAECGQWIEWPCQSFKIHSLFQLDDGLTIAMLVNSARRDSRDDFQKIEGNDALK